MLTLVLGGARSGKSRHAQALAERLAEQSGTAVTYIATAEVGDAEMAERIARHRADRPSHWLIVEEPLDLAGVITGTAGSCVLVDCLTLWLSNWLGRDERANEVAGYKAARRDLLAALSARRGDSRRHAILVANEVGLGVIPLGELTRRFVDEAGRLNQEIAALADEVVFLAAGLPLVMKTT